MEFDPSGAQFFRKRSDIAGMRGPPHQLRFFQRAKLRNERIFRVKLRRVRRNDFEIAALAERKQSVLRAAAGVYATKLPADAGVFFHEVDSPLEVAAAEKDMVKHGRNLVFG